MSNSCFTPEILETLKNKYPKIKFGLLESITEVNALDNYIETNTSLKKASPEVVKQFTEDLKTILQNVNNPDKEKSEPIRKNKFYVTLRTSLSDGSKLRDFTMHQIDDFSNTFNTAFISLYNSKNLFKLFQIEKEISTTSSKQFENENLLKVFQKFLTQKDEITGENNFNKILALKRLFSKDNVAYGNYSKDNETKLFYVESVFPLVMDFLSKYYDEHFVPNIFKPLKEEIDARYFGKTIGEKRHLDPNFKSVSDNKDVIVGSLLAFHDLFNSLYPEDKELSAPEKIDIINNSIFNKIGDRLMDVFSYNQKGFGGMEDVTEKTSEDEDESNIQSSEDNKITREGFTSSGNEKSGFESSSTETRSILSSLFDFDSKVVTDIYGMPVLLNGAVTFKKLSKILRGKIDYSSFYKTLEENKENYPFIEQLLSEDYLVNPNKDIDEFFSKSPEKRNYMQKIKQAFLQDLTKNRVEAKEIDLTVTRKWLDKKPIDTVVVQVNNAKQKKTVEILRDAVTRFHQKYFKNKEEIFEDKLTHTNGVIKLEQFINAALLWENIKNKKGTEISIKDTKNILAVLGIVPSINLENQKQIKKLKKLIIKSSSKNEKNKAYNAINNFFSKLPIKDSYFLSIIKGNKKANIDNKIKSIEKDINKIVSQYLDKKANESNISNLIDELNKIEIDKLETKDLNEFVNEEIKEEFSNYLENVKDLFINSKADVIQSKKNLIKNLTKQLRDKANSIQDDVVKSLFDDFIQFDTKYKGDKEILKSLLTITNPINELRSPLSGLYEAYSELESEFVVEDDGIIDYKNKPRYLVQSLNNLLIKSTDLNEKNDKLFLRFPELDPKRNILINSSYLFKQFYNIDENGNVSKKEQSKIKANINNITGVSLKSKVVSAGGISINDQSLDDNFMSSLILLLYNGNEENNNVDKEAAYNTQFTGIDPSAYIEDYNQKSSKSNNFLMIPSSVISKMYEIKSVEFTDKKGKVKIKRYLNLTDKANLLDKATPITNIFKNYLTHYLLEYYEIEKGNLQYVKEEYKNLGNNYKNLGLFEKDSKKDSKNYIINYELKELLKQEVLNLDLNNLSIAEKVQAINQVIEESKFKKGVKGSGEYEFKNNIINHIFSQVDSIMDKISYFKNYQEINQIAELFKNKDLPYMMDFFNTKGKKTNEEGGIKPIESKSFIKALVTTYVVNYELLSQEKMLIFNGEPMFVKESSSVKRASSTGSTGSYSLLDDFDIKYYNHPDNKESFAFAKALNKKLIKEGKPGLNMDYHKLDYTYRYGQVEDNEIKSAVHKQLTEEFKESAKLRFGNKFTEEELDKKADRALKSYLKLNEADGYGVITLDWYKIFSELTNTWSPEQNDVYMALSRGEDVPYSSLLVTFPVRKFQYTGSIMNGKDKLPADGLHKFSLAPMFPNLDNNLAIKNENLIKEGKAYEIFDSANKKEKLKNPNQEDYFYDGVQSKRIIKRLEANDKNEYNSGKQVLFAVTNLLKDQVHIDTAIKDKVIFARQLKRIGKTDLFENGVPFDFITEGNRRKEWDALTELQKRQSSIIYNKYRKIVDSISEINKIEKIKILEKLGLRELSDGSLELIPNTGKKDLIDTLKKELLKRVSQQKSGSANAFVRLMTMEANSEDPELEAFVNLRTLKSILKNIIDKETRFRKFNGSNLVQAPVTGMESTSFDKEDISVDQTGYLKTYRLGTKVNKDKIDNLEKEKQKVLSKLKTKEEKQKIEIEYNEKIDKLKATTMAEVLLTFTPEWEFLLGLEYKGEEIGTLDNLNNKALKDPEWVELHRDKISMLAVRIPIQDPNSIEAFIIKQFLPTSSGSKIVVPSEIVAKSGGDFDIDKLMVYFYNKNKETGDIAFDKSSEGLENTVIKGYFDLLLLPEMFYKLVTANSVSVLKRDKDDKISPDQIVDELEKFVGESTTVYDNTDLRMPFFNVRQKTILQTAKILLGHAATIRSNFEELKHSGLFMSNEYPITIKKYLKAKEKELLSDFEFKPEEKKLSKIRFPFQMDGQVAYNVDEEGRMNLSEIFNKDNVSITEIISAIMNGLVDVASEPWIVIFNMNDELTSYNFLMLLAGVPTKITFKVNNQKIIKDYIDNKLALKKSLFKRAFNSNRSLKVSRLLSDTFNNIVEDFMENGELSDENKDIIKQAFNLLISTDVIDNYLDTYVRTEENKEQKEINDLVFKTEIESILFEIQDNLNIQDFLTNEDLTATLGKSYKNMTVQELSNQIKLLASTIFMKPVAEGLTKSLQAIDYDKSQSEFIHDEYLNKANLKQLKSKGYFYNGKKDKTDKIDTFSRLQQLHIAAPYNFSDLTKTAAKLVAPITESEEINKYAIKLSSELLKNYFIKSENRDKMINSFKSEFLKYIIQNYGKVLISTNGKVTSENIVEYFIKNSIFVDKNALSHKLEDKSLANKLFGLLEIFDKFKDFDVFKNYLTPIKGKKINNDDELNYIYKVGRVFRNLTPSELDDYNKQMITFKETDLKINDVIQAFETHGEAVMDKFIELDDITSEEVYEFLEKVRVSRGVDSIADISVEDMEKVFPKKIVDTLFKFRNKANDIKRNVSNLLPYLSLLQSTASYSNTTIDNLFIMDNHKIVKDAIKKFKESNDYQNITEVMDNFTIPFLINNKESLLTSDKQVELLKMIAGQDLETKEGNRFSESNAINNSSYFVNYYGKDFVIDNPNTDFENANTLIETFANSGMGDSFLFRFLDLNKDSLEDLEEDLEEYEGEENVIDNLIVDDIEYIVDASTNLVTDKDLNEIKGPVKNKVLVAYERKLEKLRTTNIGEDLYYVLSNNKIITSRFTIAQLNKSEKQRIIEASTYNLDC